jgi:hypothetical protein
MENERLIVQNLQSLIAFAAPDASPKPEELVLGDCKSLDFPDD